MMRDVTVASTLDRALAPSDLRALAAKYRAAEADEMRRSARLREQGCPERAFLRDGRAAGFASVAKDLEALLDGRGVSL